MREENEKQPLYFNVEAQEYLKLINYQKQYKEANKKAQEYENALFYILNIAASALYSDTTDNIKALDNIHQKAEQTLWGGKK